MKNKLLGGFAVFLALFLSACGGFSPTQTTAKADAQYPTHEVKLLVASGVGGTLDLQARALQKEFPKYLNQPLIVVNKPGGGGRIGLNELVDAPTDGYTLGISSPELILHSIYGTSVYHYLTALEPIAQISSAPFLLTVNADSPWTSVEELLQYGKTKALKFSHSGIGTATHVLGEALAKTTHIKTVQVPFHGGSEKTAMLLGGHVDATFISPPAIKEHVKAGKLRVLATTGNKRMLDPFFTNVPTLKELGIDIEFLDWAGVASHKPLSPEVKAILAASVKKMIEDPQFQKTVVSLGAEIDYLSPEDCQKKWIVDTENFKKMIAETDIVDQIRKIQPAK